MKTTDYIRLSLEQSRGWILPLIEDMKDAATTAPTRLGGNHPHWVIGHLAYSESLLINKYMLGEESHPLTQWGEIFGAGKEPVADAAGYPPFDEVVAAFEKTRARTLNVLDGLKDEELSQPCKAPPEGAADFIGSYAQCFFVVSHHFTFHGGQVADARRAAGKVPLMG